MLRRLGFKKHEHRESEARIKLRKELFAYNECVNHGFPHKPSALAYDPKLKLLAIGTSNGAIKVVGAPGVEYSGLHATEEDVVQLHFIPDQGRLISVCSDNTLYLWEINIKDGKSILEKVKEYAMENSKNTSITGCTVVTGGEQFLIGTEGGNIHTLDIATFKVIGDPLYQDVVMQNAPEDYKVNPGAVEVIVEQPGANHVLLIGYNKGLLVLWDTKEKASQQTYNTGQQLESVCWFRDGTQFMSSHSDGSHIVWNTADATKPVEQTTPYGPFPCKAINKVAWKSTKTDAFTIFSGGMPRASYGDRHTVSVQQGPKHTVFDFTSKVVNFVVLSDGDDKDTEFDEPHSLIVLAKEELVAVDLQSENWQQIRLPYLYSLHSSAITCAQYACSVSERLYKQIIEAGESQFTDYSNKEWPITGGRNLSNQALSRDLLLTGHEDGSIRFYDSSTTSLRLLYKSGTGQLFSEGHIEPPEADPEDEWPPFRKVGTFDPYSDDPRLGIQKILMCPLSETLVVGGTAGQIVTLKFSREETSSNIMPVICNIVSDRDSFAWKGHDALTPRNEEIKYKPGFQPVGIMQLYPPASCTALALQSDWQLVAAGTAHGMALFDYLQGKVIVTQCTLNPEDLAGGENVINRKKSFKKSLRESFRRLRSKRKSPREAKTKRTQKEETGKLEEQKTSPSTEAGPSNPTETVQLTEGKTVERQVESRTIADDGMGSMVRSLYFADTFLLAGQSHGATLWMGTNSGTVFSYRLVVPTGEPRKSEAVSCQLAKEIQLKHHAPVISICIVDRTATPLPDPLAVQCGVSKPADTTGSHQLLLASEEQFKVFSLPHLKALNKYKLTAHEGSRIRKVSFVNYRSKSDENYCEADLTCLTNQGEVQVFTIPALRRQLNVTGISGITSGLFTNNGQGFYLNSPSEYHRFSLSARNVTTPHCTVDLKEGLRPAAPEPATPEETPEASAGITEQGERGAGEPAVAAGASASQNTESAPAPCESSTQEQPGDTSVVVSERGDDSTILSVNDSMAMGDITADSVKVHMTEETLKSDIQEGGTTITKTIEKRIVTKTEEHGMIMKTSQKVILESSSGSHTIETSAVEHRSENEVSETPETSESEPVEQLAELRITEEGDEPVENEDTNTPVNNQVPNNIDAVQTVVDVHVNADGSIVANGSTTSG